MDLSQVKRYANLHIRQLQIGYWPLSALHEKFKSADINLYDVLLTHKEEEKKELLSIHSFSLLRNYIMQKLS